jgi:hypothetical protein
MQKYLLLVVSAVAIVWQVGAAQGRDFGDYGGHSGTPEQQRACRPDVIRHCRGMSDDYAIEGCLRANVERLRPACRHVIQGG